MLTPADNSFESLYVRVNTSPFAVAVAVACAHRPTVPDTTAFGEELADLINQLVFGSVCDSIQNKATVDDRHFEVLTRYDEC
jgi:hypothetical protein